VTGYPLGAVSPFSTRQTLRILVDHGVVRENEISVGSGVRYTTVIIRCEDFMHALGQVEVGDFTAEQSIE
jgi:prolyl-tRNA editing enzyme YbaK/EbsC (Cys-tRNA(Pro) deacylase)